MCFQYLQPTPVLMLQIGSLSVSSLLQIDEALKPQVLENYLKEKLSSHPFCLQDELRQCFPGVMIEKPICRLVLLYLCAKTS